MENYRHQRMVPVHEWTAEVRVEMLSQNVPFRLLTPTVFDNEPRAAYTTVLGRCADVRVKL